MKLKSLASLSLAAVLSGTCLAGDVDFGTEQSWLDAGAKAVQDRLQVKPNTKRAKNVILFIGDGMSITTLTASRILEGQMEGRSGEENYLSFEEFPYTALVKTYNVDAQVPDSAGTASSINTGSKTRMGVINTGPAQPQGVCKGIADNLLTPLAYYAEQAGLSTGVVSTARLTHATPAAVYAHSPDRDWEADIDLPDEAKENGCADIAQQITADMGGNGLEIALGGGRQNFLPKGTGVGKRADGRNITDEWLKAHDGAAYVENLADLQAVDLSKTKHLLGLFSKSHMDYDADHSAEQPDLATMTETAIKMLSQNKKGYYLMVEAGRIDHGHHDGNAYNALHDAVALSKAVARARELVNLDDTLILVTADHAHTFTMAGYPKRGNPILGLVSAVGQKDGEYLMAKDGKPYTTVGYQNGPGAIKGERETLTEEQVMAPDFHQQAAYPTSSETHGGEDVGLFAIGPRSYVVHGTMEQNVVFHLMDHALDLRERAAKAKK
ncbi:MAG: alkaline phosphatase [Alphaproteobacteria bacterium]|nr:MAG: alkaline phosphatase [Alphaproteobacteria bacterium]